MSDVVVRLTQGQAVVLQDLVRLIITNSPTDPWSEHGIAPSTQSALERAAAALADAKPVLTKAEYDALTDATAEADANWEGEHNDRRRPTLDRATAKVWRTMKPRR